jgi:hypothetical protein
MRGARQSLVSSNSGTAGRSDPAWSPSKKVAGTLKRHLDGVLRFVKHPITNGVAEGLKQTRESSGP